MTQNGMKGGRARMTCSAINSFCWLWSSLYNFSFLFLLFTVVQVCRLLSYYNVTLQMGMCRPVPSSGWLLSQLQPLQEGSIHKCMGAKDEAKRLHERRFQTRMFQVPSWSDCRTKRKEPRPGRGSLDAVGLYINNQTHSVVFIMCAKCYLCYLKKAYKWI